MARTRARSGLRVLSRPVVESGEAYNKLRSTQPALARRLALNPR